MKTRKNSCVNAHSLPVSKSLVFTGLDSRRNSMMSFIRTSSVFGRSKEHSEKDESTSDSILQKTSFLGQIYKNVKFNFSRSNSTASKVRKLCCELLKNLIFEGIIYMGFSGICSKRSRLRAGIGDLNSKVYQSIVAKYIFK